LKHLRSRSILIMRTRGSTAKFCFFSLSFFSTLHRPVFFPANEIQFRVLCSLSFYFIPAASAILAYQSFDIFCPLQVLNASPPYIRTRTSSPTPYGSPFGFVAASLTCAPVSSSLHKTYAFVPYRSRSTLFFRFSSVHASRAKPLSPFSYANGPRPDDLNLRPDSYRSLQYPHSLS